VSDQVLRAPRAGHTGTPRLGGIRAARARRPDRGAAAVEFALVLVPMLIIIFGLIQYGMYFYSAQTGSNTLNAAARQVSVGNCDTAAELQSFVDARLGAAADGSATVSREYFDPAGTSLGSAAADAVIGGTVTLTIDFPTINLNFPFVPFLDDPKVSRTVVVRVEDTTDQGCPS
jgi:Flp pilus assembly protein TadG